MNFVVMSGFTGWPNMRTELEVFWTSVWPYNWQSESNEVPHDQCRNAQMAETRILYVGRIYWLPSFWIFLNLNLPQSKIFWSFENFAEISKTPCKILILINSRYHNKENLIEKVISLGRKGPIVNQKCFLYIIFTH